MRGLFLIQRSSLLFLSGEEFCLVGVFLTSADMQIKSCRSSAATFFHLPLPVAGKGLGGLLRVTGLMLKTCCVTDMHMGNVDRFIKRVMPISYGERCPRVLFHWDSEIPAPPRTLVPLMILVTSESLCISVSGCPKINLNCLF